MSVTIRGSGTLPIQIVQGSTTSSVSVTTNTLTSSGLTATITPSNTANKILVTATFGCYCQTSAQMWFTIYRNSTNLATGASGFGWIYAGSTGMGSAQSVVYLDSPSTTSATTYTIYIANSNIATGIFNNPTGIGSPNTQQALITLQEISGA
jgi:hypothetical protein